MLTYFALSLGCRHSECRLYQAFLLVGCYGVGHRIMSSRLEGGRLYRYKTAGFTSGIVLDNYHSSSCHNARYDVQGHVQPTENPLVLIWLSRSQSFEYSSKYITLFFKVAILLNLQDSNLMNSKSGQNILLTEMSEKVWILRAKIKK